MTNLSKVVWSEGMYLGPHHFQAQSLFFEGIVDFTTAALFYEPYGLLACDPDAEALRNGAVSLRHASGFFPDGLSFAMPESDPLPEPLQIATLFPPTSDRLTVYLAVHKRVPGGANCSLNGAAPAGARFLARAVTRLDENSGSDEKEIWLGRKQIFLAAGTLPGPEFVSIPLARVARDGKGEFIFDEMFVPPCVRISASSRLMSLTRRLVETLEDKTAQLSAAARGVSEFSSGFSSDQVASHWFLHALNAALGPLRHTFYCLRGHPEQLYRELLKFAGALCTFGLSSNPSTLPLYDHMRLDEVFDALDRHIREHLELIVPSSCFTVPLRRTANYIYEGDIVDERCFAASRWILGVQSKLGESDLISLVPQLAKLCSSRFVPELVKRALPGMTLKHIEMPPAAISPRVDYQYFSVSKAGPCWDHVRQSKRAGIYVPGEIPDPKLELSILIGGAA